MAQKIVKRGVVLITKSRLADSKETVSAVVSRVEAESMQKRFGGRIVNVAGQPYRMAQKTLRVLVNPAYALEA